MSSNSLSRGGGRLNSRSSTRAVLSAERLSFKTGREIGHFGTSPRETSLPSTHVVTDLKEIDDNPLKVAAKGKTKKVKVVAKGPKGPKAQVSDDAVEKAMVGISGILILLSPQQRAAVLKKINGAFGFSGKSDKPKVSAKPKAEPKPKLPFNESFAKTFPGALLLETSKVMKKSASSAEFVVSPSVYQVHKYLIEVRADTKEKGNVDTLSPIPPKGDPGKILTNLVENVEALEMAKLELSVPELALIGPNDVVEGAISIFRGSPNSFVVALEGKIPSEEARPKAALLNKRADAEKAKRAAIILAQRAAKKARLDPKGPARESDESRIQDTEEPAPEVAEREETEMALDVDDQGGRSS